MNPEHLSDDEFCRYADTDNPWIKSAVERLEAIKSPNEAIDDAYSLIETAQYKISKAMEKLESIE